MTCERIVTPSASRNALQTAPPATRAAVSRAEARSRMSRTSLEPVLAHSTRSACPGRGRWTSATCLVDGPRVHPLFPVRVVAVVDLKRDRPTERPPVTHARRLRAHCRSRSSSARRGHGRVAGAPCRDRSPRGRVPAPPAGPATMHVRPGPCDSPAVIRSTPTRGRLFADAQSPGAARAAGAV